MNIRKLKDWYKKNKKIILVSLTVGLITSISSHYIKPNYQATSVNLEEKFIRFHVIANSDYEEDQELKVKVKDAILKEIKPILNDSNNIEQSRQLLLDNTEEIKSIAQKIIKENNKNYNVTVNLEKTNFPIKSYGDIVLPSGEYEALRVIIGEGQGKNWWCVMFPPLCFVDITHGTVDIETKEELKSILTEEEYSLITDDTSIKVKFKIVEWLEKSKPIETILASIKDK